MLQPQACVMKDLVRLSFPNRTYKEGVFPLKSLLLLIKHLYTFVVL